MGRPGQCHGHVGVHALHYGSRERRGGATSREAWPAKREEWTRGGRHRQSRSRATRMEGKIDADEQSGNVTNATRAQSRRAGLGSRSPRVFADPSQLWHSRHPQTTPPPGIAGHGSRLGGSASAASVSALARDLLTTMGALPHTQLY